MFSSNIRVPLPGGYIPSTIHKPEGAKIIVLISHEPGSGRFCSRNKQIASQLEHAGFATLLCDWNLGIGQHSEFDPYKRAQSLTSTIYWLKNHHEFGHLEPVYYGCSTGAASALMAASEKENGVLAVISRNGRLEIADSYLNRVKSPTLVVVGDKDYRLIKQNTEAYKKLECPKKFLIVPGITPFFENPKMVEKMGRMAINWIKRQKMKDMTSGGKAIYNYSN